MSIIEHLVHVISMEFDASRNKADEMRPTLTLCIDETSARLPTHTKTVINLQFKHFIAPDLM